MAGGSGWGQGRSGLSVWRIPRQPSEKKIAVGQRGTLGARLRELIREGLDKAAIWKIVKKEYSLDDNRRGYVSGQRVYMPKRGL